MAGTINSKVSGDAGEHYALSQFSFAGRYAAKMPDNWKAYDLVVEEEGGRSARVSVKLRTETDRWLKASCFQFDGDDNNACDWLVLIFKPKDYPLKPLASWVIPFEVAKREAAKPGVNARPRQLDLKWRQLQEPPLNYYKENWSLSSLGRNKTSP
jgi:hypothetical protein